MDEWQKKLRKKHKTNDLIINRPEAMSSLRQKTEISITTIGWIVWIFICRPLIIFLLWFIGLRIFFVQMVDLGGFVGLKQMWVGYAIIIIVVYIMTRGWILYNKLHYGKKNKRQKMQPTSGEELEECFSLPEKSISQFHTFHTLTVDFKPDNKFIISEGDKESKDSKEGHFHPT